MHRVLRYVQYVLSCEMQLRSFMGGFRRPISSGQDFSTKIQPTQVTQPIYAPTASILGMNPSFKLLSNLLISSTDVALAIASFTLSASSFDMSRPAFPDATTGRGSSVEIVCFVEFVETVVDIVVANEFMRPSGVKNNPLAVFRSLSRIL